MVPAPSGSSGRHGISHADAEDAVKNNMHWLREFDEPRAPSTVRPDLFIGPDMPGAVVLEVTGTWRPGGVLELFHVMPLRQKTKERVKKIAEQDNRR